MEQSFIVKTIGACWFFQKWTPSRLRIGGDLPKKIVVNIVLRLVNRVWILQDTSKNSWRRFLFSDDFKPLFTPFGIILNQKLYTRIVLDWFKILQVHQNHLERLLELKLKFRFRKNWSVIQSSPFKLSSGPSDVELYFLELPLKFFPYEQTVGPKPFKSSKVSSAFCTQNLPGRKITESPSYFDLINMQISVKVFSKQNLIQPWTHQTIHRWAPTLKTEKLLSALYIWSRRSSTAR